MPFGTAIRCSGDRHETAGITGSSRTIRKKSEVRWVQRASDVSYNSKRPKMVRPKQIIKAFLQRRQRNETSRMFAEWLEHPIHRESKDNALWAYWDSPVAGKDPQSREHCWQVVRHRIHALTPPRRRPLRHIAAAVAAVLFPLVFLFIGYNRGTRSNGSETLASLPQLVECTTSYGELRRIVLPDSTHVVLDAGSILIYPERFHGAKREIYLSGKADFRVTHDADHPFVVHTTSLRTEVLGTVFCVTSYADEPDAEVTLCEGCVRVSGTQSASEGFILTSGEQLHYDRQSGIFSRRNVSADDAVAWEKGGLVFRREGLHAIIRALERRYGIKVYLSSERYDKDLLTLRIASGCSADEAIRLIAQLIPGLHFRFDEKNVYLD